VTDPLIYHRGRPAWCPGCGNYGVFAALKKALSVLEIPPEKIVIVSGIGCSSFIWSYLNTNSLKVVHGRVLPAATGVKLANPELEVIGVAGDGDAYSIGGNHLIHAARRNPDITYIVVDNGVFGNTRGQPSPTYLEEKPEHNLSGWHGDPVNPLLLALACGVSFVAQGFAGDTNHLTGLFTSAITHRGFSLVNVLSPCPTFNPRRDYKWLRSKLEYLDNEIRKFDEAIKMASFSRYICGVIYTSEKPTYSERIRVRGAPVKQPIEGLAEKYRELARRELGLRV